MLIRNRELWAKVKRILKEILDWGLVVFLLPQLFLFFYYFSFLFKRQANWLTLVAAIAKYGLSISWVSLPFFSLLYVGVRCCFARRISGLKVWLLSFFFGGAWIVFWNWGIYPTFEYWRSAVPLLLCSSFACLYAVAGHLYREGAVIEEPFDYHEPPQAGETPEAADGGTGADAVSPEPEAAVAPPGDQKGSQDHGA